MATYDKIKNKTNNHEIQVQSAIEDGDGQVITETYLKHDGYYSELTAGLADNFTSNMALSDSIPYSSRTAGGSLEVGEKCYVKSVVGGTVVFNQLFNNSNGLALTRWAGLEESKLTVINEGTSAIPQYRYTVSQGAHGYLSWYIGQQSGYAGHKYFISLTITNGSGQAIENAYLGVLFGIELRSKLEAGKNHVCKIVSLNNDNSTTYFGITSLFAYGDMTFEDINIFDLTVMFGADVANNIYLLEQSNSGSGVSWFKQFFPKNCYNYNSGELLSVKTSGKKVVGFNAYNHLTGSAKLLGGHIYQVSGTYSSLAFEDINGNLGTVYHDADGKFTPENDCTVLVVGGNDTDTCIHLVWDGERDGEFEEFDYTVYSVSDIDLRGVLKLDGGNNLYYDGDLYNSDGTVIKKYGTKTLTVAYSSGDTISISDVLSDTVDIICDKYGALNFWGTISGKTLTLTKALSVGTTILYKLDYPVEETAIAFAELQSVDNWGTEEFIDGRDIPIPVGHITKYLPDLKAKLEVAPESPDADGYYVMKRDSGENSYSSLNTWLADNNYGKKEEIALTNFGTISSTALVGGAFYHNDIAVSGGVSASDIIFVKMSNGTIYPAVNYGGNTLTVFCASDLSSLTIQKVWKI